MRKGEEVTCMAPTVPNPDSAWEPSSLPGHGPPGHGPLGRSKRLRRLRREEGGGIRARSYLHQPQQALSFVADEPTTHTQRHRHTSTRSRIVTHTQKAPWAPSDRHMAICCHPSPSNGTSKYPRVTQCVCLHSHGTRGLFPGRPLACERHQTRKGWEVSSDVFIAIVQDGKLPL